MRTWFKYNRRTQPSEEMIYPCCFVTTRYIGATLTPLPPLLPVKAATTSSEGSRSS
eukprot:COSAG01_NODE_424_length_17253_cov_31.601900_9_plen_56_part_00